MALEKCLCTFPLRTGTIIIGVAFMIFAVVDMAFCIYRIDTDEDLGRFHNIIWIARVCDWIGEVINFALSGFLIYGAIKGKEIFLIWWIWYIGVAAIVVAILLVGAILMFFAFSMNLEATISSVVTIAATLLVVHALRVVHSFRIELMTRNSLPHVILSQQQQQIANNDILKKDSPPRYVPLK